MNPANLTERLVGDVASVHFGATGVAIERCVEIVRAGERGDASRRFLRGHIGAPLQRLDVRRDARRVSQARAFRSFGRQ